MASPARARRPGREEVQGCRYIRAEASTREEEPAVPMNCPHRATPLTLPYGGQVIGSGCFERTPDDVVPDFGLYAYDGWRPTWPAAFIDWPDFGLPVDTDEATRLIVDAFARVQERRTRRGRVSRRERPDRLHHRVHGDPGGHRAVRRGRVDAGALLLARDRHEGTGALGRGVHARSTLAPAVRTRPPNTRSCQTPCVP